METKSLTPKEEVDRLHQEKTAALSQNVDALMDYLLRCQEFLKTGDVSGWKESFAPELLIPESPKKRRRGSPSALLWTPLPPCRSCKSSETIEDVKEGSVVCTACGIIQSTQTLGIDVAHMSIDRLMNGHRHVVHRYSRVVYFRSFLMSIQGNTRPVLSTEEQASLRLTLGGEKVITGAVVASVIKRLKLSNRLRRHTESIAITMSGGVYKPIVIPTHTFFELLTLFRRVEFWWDHGMSKNMPGRRVFLSYPYVYYQLCHHLKLHHLSGKHHLLQSRKLLGKLHKAYGRLARKAKLTKDLDVYR